jgi:chromosome segregation ATPase
MARSGVDFEAVASAALRLCGRGQVVTVDSVRSELGDTGSKSTLAPLVRRWKVEYAQSMERSLDTLPSDLVAAVKRLHDDLQQRFDESLLAAQTAAEAKVAELATLNAEHVRNLEMMRAESNQLAGELSSARSELADFTTRQAAAAIATNELKIRYETLEQISEASTAENAHLRELIEHGRRQLEHFQNASQLRWEAERSNGEEKLAQAKAEFNELQAALQQNRQQLMALQGRLEQLAPAYERLTQDVESKRNENTRQKQEISKLIVQVEQKTALCALLDERATESARKLADTEASLAACRSRTELLSEQAAMHDVRLQGANAEIARISSLYAEIRAELRHIQGKERPQRS